MRIFFLLLLLCCPVCTTAAQSLIIPLPGAGLMAWHSGSALLAATCDDGIAVIEAGTQIPIHILKNKGQITTLAWSPDAGSIVYGGQDGSVRLWKTGSPAARILPKTGAAVTALAWKSDGRQFVAGSAAGTLELRDAQTGTTGRTLKGHTAGIASVVWADDEIRSVDTRGTLIRWSSTTGMPLYVVPGKDSVISTAWSSDGASVLVAGTGGTVIRQVLTGDNIPLPLHDKTLVRSASWSQDGTIFATAGDQGEVTLWDISSGAPPVWLRQTIISNLQSIAVIDPYTVAVSNTKDIILYDLTMGTDVTESAPALPAVRLYPNPVPGTGTVEFSLEAPAHVRLTITDMQGRELATLCDEQLPAGPHSCTLGSIPAAGIYMLRLSTPQGRAIIPFVVVR